jgi:hypothetical protein
MEAELKQIVSKLNRIEKAINQQPGDWVTVKDMCLSMQVDRRTFDRDFARKMPFLFRPKAGGTYRAKRVDFENFKEAVATGKIML